MITTERMSDHFTKYHLNDRGQLPILCHPVLHHFTSADDGTFHDHPFGLWCTVLYGGYVEEVLDIATGDVTLVAREVHDTFYVAADHVHRIVYLPAGECVTVSTYEPGNREVYLYRVRDGLVQHLSAASGPWVDGAWPWVDGLLP